MDTAATENGGDRSKAVAQVLWENHESMKQMMAPLDELNDKFKQWGRDLMGFKLPATGPQKVAEADAAMATARQSVQRREAPVASGDVNGSINRMIESDRLAQDVEKATRRWPEAAKAGMQAYIAEIEASGGAATAKAEEIAGRVRKALAPTVAPIRAPGIEGPGPSAHLDTTDAVRKLGEIHAAVGGATAGVGIKAAANMAAVTAAVVGEGGKASAAAGSAGAAIAAALNIVARPVVDITSIAAASRAVATLKEALASIGGASVGGKIAVSATTLTAGAISDPAASNDGPDGKRASGGPMRAGLTYLVGERGPETVTAGRNSYVTPTHVLERQADRSPMPPAAHAGPVTIHAPITIHAGGRGGHSIANEIVRALSSQLNRSSQLAIDGRM